jgi:hypothetical protein
MIQAYCPLRPALYQLVHDRLVQTPPWETLVRLTKRQGADGTASRAFPGVYLKPSYLKTICARNGMELMSIKPDPGTLGSYWAYGRRD